MADLPPNIATATWPAPLMVMVPLLPLNSSTPRMSAIVSPSKVGANTMVSELP